MGDLETHNVCSPENMNADGDPRKIDIDSLRDTVCPSPNDKARLSMLVGNFNFHHAAWELPRKGKPSKKGGHFADTMDACKMQLITEPGMPTWRLLKARTHQVLYQSTIDLMFASQALASHMAKSEWRDMKVAAFKSDHCVIGATIVAQPRQFLARRFCWNLDNDTSRRLREGVTKTFGKLSTHNVLYDKRNNTKPAIIMPSPQLPRHMFNILLYF
ncbi:hypothetical protein diail_8498 [Diaporthe ilicicola]|nr:hypothetical protein diail_8498 [Diaporthe ilicicola]